MLVFYLKKIATHFLAYSIFLGLLILAPSIMTVVFVGLASYAASLLLFTSLFSPRSNSSLPLWLSFIVSIFAFSLLLPAIQPWILTSLIPALVTPVGFIVITLVLVSLTTEFVTLGSTYNPLRLIFSRQTRKNLERDYENDSSPDLGRSLTVERLATNNRRPQELPTSVTNRRPAGSPPPPDFKPNPRKLKDITLSPEEEKRLFERQVTALEELDQLVIAQQDGNYAFTDLQMDLYRRFLKIEKDQLICPLTLERYGESNKIYGFLYKERYQARTKTWDIEPDLTHFFSTQSDGGLIGYFNSKSTQPASIITHPVHREPIATENPYTRYRFHRTKKLQEYNPQYNSEPYRYYLNTDVIYYAEHIVASGAKLNNTLQFNR